MKKDPRTFPAYPIPEFGGFLTWGVQVFRGKAETGLDFLEEPAEFVCLSAAAYQVTLGQRLKDKYGTAQGPTRPLSGEERKTHGKKVEELAKEGLLELTPEYAVLTYRKIRSLLLIAYRANCEVIVLSALGCGAFGNPPERIAHIFSELLQEFAGAFREVIFAILPGRNYDTFSQVLGERRVLARPSAPKQGLIDAEEWSLQLSPRAGAAKRLCRFGGNCHNLWQRRRGLGVLCTAQYHPALCGCTPAEQQQRHAESRHRARWHLELYSHRQLCPNGADCPTISDVLHEQIASHDFQWCSQPNTCPDLSREHNKSFRHKPPCTRDAASCALEEKRDQNHRLHFRHVLESACDGCDCKSWRPQHLQMAHTPDHRICAEMWCKDLSARHFRESLHVHRDFCTDGAACGNLSSDHLDSLFHDGRRGLYDLCSYGRRCNILSWEHNSRNRHVPERLPWGCQPYMLSPFDAHTNGLIPFKENLDRLASGLDRFLGAPGPHFQEIVRHVQGLRPVHRCKPSIFGSILTSGSFFSLKQLTMGTAEKLVMTKLEMINPPLTPTQRDAAQWLVEHLRDNKTVYFHQSKWLDIHLGSDLKDQIKEVFQGLQSWHDELLKAERPGIGYEGDKICGLDDTVFAILGPHRTENYGNIFCIFRTEIMLHPSSYFLPCAGTFFNKGSSAVFTGLNQTEPKVRRTEWGVRDHRLGSPGARPELPHKDIIKQMSESMWHCSVPDWQETIAKELIARTCQWKKAPAASIRWRDILDFNTACEGHAWLEAHLPHEVPVSYLEEVIINAEDWFELEKELWTKEKVEQALGSGVKLRIVHSAELAAKAAEEACTRPQLWHHSGLAFTADQDLGHFHSPTGLHLRPGAPRWLRFKASALASFNLVLTEDRDQLERGADGAFPPPIAPQTLILTFMEDGSVRFHTGPLSTTHNCFNDFRALGQVTGQLDKGLPVDSASQAVGLPMSSVFQREASRSYQTCFEFVEYTLQVDGPTVVLKHSGPSEALMPPVDPAKFQLARAFNSIVYVAVSVVSAANPVTIYDMQVLSTSPPSCRETFKQILRAPASQVIGKLPDPEGINDIRPWCTFAAAVNMPIELCPKLSDLNHTASFRHVCLFGQSCRFLQPDMHTHKDFVSHHRETCHKRLEMCTYGARCRQLRDPVHRARFHHTNSPQWMRACWTQGCRKTENDHDKNFLHLPGDPKEKAAILNSLRDALIQRRP